ncbi:hypothetical protein BDD12DRAFT_407159 [Trichophaea hybrida]|nr:hypothetical protein BDD12DRAFT_407159 [Trichophaea hybrida]
MNQRHRTTSYLCLGDFSQRAFASLQEYTVPIVITTAGFSNHSLRIPRLEIYVFNHIPHPNDKRHTHHLCSLRSFGRRANGQGLHYECDCQAPRPRSSQHYRALSPHPLTRKPTHIFSFPLSHPSITHTIFSRMDRLLSCERAKITAPQLSSLSPNQLDLIITGENRQHPSRPEPISMPYALESHHHIPRHTNARLQKVTNRCAKQEPTLPGP